MNLSNAARLRLDQHFSDTAKAFGVTPQPPSIGQQFSATPSVAQTIYDKVVEDGNEFLKLINMVPVSEIKGEKVGLSLTGRTASRTDVSGSGERTPKDLAAMDGKGYELSFTEFDVALGYAKIDSWAKFKDFRERYMRLVRQAIGNDMLQTGWTGLAAAAASNIVTNPLLEDLNKGWLQIMREFNSGSQYLLGNAGSVTLGAAGFENLDVLAKAAKDMLPVYHRNRDDLVLLTGANVLSKQEDTYFETNGNTPTEKAMLSGRITKAYANMPAITPPFFPDSAIMVTPLENLSIYYQDSSVRRLQKDKPEKNQVQEFNSVNMGYVVEDEEQAAFIEGIEGL